MDRDLAEEIIDLTDKILNYISVIEDNLCSPFIITQPTDITSALGTTVYFTLEAVNVKEYNWQYKNNSGNWTNTTLLGHKTNSLRVPVTQDRIGRLFRCQVTGLNDTMVTSREVTIIEPETNEPET